MATLSDILKRDVNPFGTIEPRSGNFWEEQQDANLTVDSIHQEEFHQMTTAIERVAKDRRTRTMLLRGEVASGKRNDNSTKAPFLPTLVRGRTIAIFGGIFCGIPSIV
jgi:hypothetical protein